MASRSAAGRRRPDAFERVAQADGLHFGGVPKVVALAGGPIRMVSMIRNPGVAVVRTCSTTSSTSQENPVPRR